MNIFREIFEGNQDQKYIHKQFIKYGKGKHAGPTAHLTKNKKKITIKASYGYENILTYLALKATKEKIKTKGNIIAYEDIKDGLMMLGIKIEGERKKRKTIIYKIKDTYPAETLTRALKEYPECVFLLDIANKEIKLKTKNTPPKPGKEQDEKYISLQLPAAEEKTILKELCFGEPIKEIDDIKISYEYLIKDYDIPREYQKNPAKARLHAKRKGTAERIIQHRGMKNILATEIKV